MRACLQKAFFILLLCLAQNRAGELGLTVTHTGAEAVVRLSGTDGIEYLLEASSDAARGWQAITSFLLNDETQIWRQREADAGMRLFRARTVSESDDRYAPNFRLIDQNGLTRELHYYHQLSSLKAIVIVFAEGNYSAFAPKIRELRNAPDFKDSTLFWTVETGSSNSRSNIVREASLAGIDWPVMHDPLQLTKRDYGARFNGEVFLIRRFDLKILYRGLIDDAFGAAGPTKTYLATALSNAVAFTPIVTTRMEPARDLLSDVHRTVADYATVIAPLLQKRCVICHSPDNVAPFALTNYQTVIDYRLWMKEEIMAGNMPPWHADPEYGKFKNDLSLTPSERALLVDWLDAGAPRTGDIDPLTNVPPPPSEWPAELGPPDQAVTIPLQNIQASGSVPYRYIYTQATNTVDHWLRAAVVRPSNRAVVHHYLVWEGRSSAELAMAAYTPGRTEGAYPEGTGWLLKAKMDLTFNLHYTATGKPETDQPRLGLWYASAPPERALKAAAAQNASFLIPPENPDYQTTARHIFKKAARVYLINPHMHLRGSRMRYELTVPGQPKQIIASIPRYDFHWQTVYHFDPPLDLPANSTIDVIGAFDNSRLNHHNPNPAVSVKWGNESWDEMFIGYLEYSDLE